MTTAGTAITIPAAAAATQSQLSVRGSAVVVVVDVVVVGVVVVVVPVVVPVTVTKTVSEPTMPQTTWLLVAVYHVTNPDSSRLLTEPFSPMMGLCFAPRTSAVSDSRR